MARPIRIPIVSDVSGFLRGTQDVEGALDDVSGSLDSLSREAEGAGDRAGEGISSGVKDGARDAEQAVDDLADSGRNLDRIGDDAEAAFEQASDSAKAEMKIVESEVDNAAKDVESSAERMERSFKDAFDTVKKESRDVGDTAKRGFDEASEGAGEFRDEANSTAREAAASFDGSAESIGDAFQEVAANAFAGFGPAGAAAGLAAAAGLGIVISKFQEAQEEAERFDERVGQLREAFLAVELDGDSSLQQIIDRMREIATETDESKTHLDELVDSATELSEIDWTEYLKGVAGDPESRQGAIDLAREHIEVESERLDQVGQLTDAERAAALDRLDQAKARLEILGAESKAEEEAHNARLDQAAAAIEAEQRRVQKQEEIVEQIQEQADAEADAREDAQRRIREDIAETTSAWQEHFDKVTDDGEITFEELGISLDKMLADQQAKAEYWTTVNRHLTEEQALALEEFGEDKYQVLDTLMNQPPAVRDEALAKLQTAGEQLAGAQVEGYEKELPNEIDGPKVIFEPDDSNVRFALRNIGTWSGRLPIYMDAIRNDQVMP